MIDQTSFRILCPATFKTMCEFVHVGMSRRHSHVPALGPNLSSIPHKLTSSTTGISATDSLYMKRQMCFDRPPITQVEHRMA
jgi:hypothetical protein